MNRTFFWLVLLVCVIVVAALGYVNYVNIAEAYGSGPPYYGRTVNMDKWQNPLPFILTLDAVTLALCILAANWSVRRLRRTTDR